MEYTRTFVYVREQLYSSREPINTVYVLYILYSIRAEMCSQSRIYLEQKSVFESTWAHFEVLFH